MVALTCFKRALHLDSNNMKLWIEYGSLAYWLQSMISRSRLPAPSLLQISYYEITNEILVEWVKFLLVEC